MTLNNILNEAIVSTKTLSDMIAFRDLKNSIEDSLNMYKRNFTTAIQDSIMGICNGSIYNHGCCVSNESPLADIIPESDKEYLMEVIKEQAKKAVENFKKTISSFEDTNVKEDEPDKKEVEVNIQVQKPEITPVATANENYFGY